jgi:hypothetical protein
MCLFYVYVFPEHFEIHTAYIQWTRDVSDSQGPIVRIYTNGSMKGLAVETPAIGGACQKFLRIFKAHSSFFTQPSRLECISFITDLHEIPSSYCIVFKLADVYYTFYSCISSSTGNKNRLSTIDPENVADIMSYWNIAEVLTFALRQDGTS